MLRYQDLLYLQYFLLFPMVVYQTIGQFALFVQKVKIGNRNKLLIFQFGELRLNLRG